jgi:hypothetical protein
MKLRYWLKKFQKAVLENDYAEQSRIAEKLQLFEACGMIEEKEIVDIINNPSAALI